MAPGAADGKINVMQGHKRRRAAQACAVALLGLAPAAAPGAGLADLTLEELANLEVTSVSRRAERLPQAPASIFVITGEDIRRSGATSLPEALRLAPNLQVARIDATQYAISARGFNNAVGNKLLVLIDGRTVYTPLFSGVFWDQQDVMLEDVERIEVISGPGATLWGANAVNGVINVITRPSSDTHGVLVSAGAGNLEQTLAARYGGRLDAGGHFRLYAKGTRLQNTWTGADAAVADGRDWGQAGFRADWLGGRGGFTLQGDVYHGRSDDRGAIGPFVAGRIEVEGMNLLGRWTRELDNGTNLRIQGYLDHARRVDRALFQPDAQTADIELQHDVPLDAHRVVWGGGYRRARDHVTDGIISGMRPKSRELDWVNIFVQDEMRLAERFTLTAGLRLEKNDYTGWEYMPSLRAAWTSAVGLVWASASRAVRTPSRFDRDVVVPLLPGFALGGPHFEAEVAHVYELGFRAQPTQTFSWSATLFRHEWDRLRSGTVPPLVLENRIEGPVHGLEAWGTWQATPGWRLSAGLLSLDKDLELEAGSTDPVGVDNPTLANDPEYQWMIRSSHRLGPSADLDAMLRRVGRLPNPEVRGYTALDVRLAWRPAAAVEWFLVVRNLLDPEHPEFGDPPIRSEIERSVFLGVRWSP